MTLRAGMAAFAILATAACNGPAQPSAPPAAQPIRPLAATEPAGNAERIAAFMRQQCVERTGNKALFEEGLRASGWSTREILVNAYSRRGVVGTYEFSGGFVSASFDGRSGNCLFAIDAPMSAPFESLRDALSRFGGSPTADTGHGTTRWRWRGEPGYDYSMDLTFGAGSEQGQIRISFFVTRPAQ